MMCRKWRSKEPEFAICIAKFSAMELITIQQKIYQVRGEQVMLDFDLAEMFEVETKRLKEQVRRNLDRFPPAFMFTLTTAQWNALRSQFAALETGRGQHPKYLPFAFTEHGVTMLANMLRSERAMQMSIAIVRAFIAMRKWALNYKELAEKIAEMEQKYDKQFADIYEALRYLMAEQQGVQNGKSENALASKNHDHHLPQRPLQQKPRRTRNSSGRKYPASGALVPRRAAQRKGAKDIAQKAAYECR
jgi:phage regulator Rha-like protein